MSKEEKIKREIEEIWYTLLNAKTAFYYAQYLFEPPTQIEKDYMKHFGVEMTFFRNVLWKNAIIELANLFSKNQKRSLEKFLNKVDVGGVYSKKISAAKVNELRSRLNSYDNIITQVLEMRNTMFAHADKEYHISNKYVVFLGDVEDLILFCENFISDIFQFFDAGVIHDAKLLRDDFNILKILADYEEKKHTDIINSYKNIAKDIN